MRFWLAAIMLSGLVASTSAFDKQVHRFDRLLLNEEFRSEGAAFGDLDGDGDNDIVSGSFWYEGPDFRTRRQYVPGRAFSINEYSQHFFSWVYDVSGDGKLDIVVVGFPGQAGLWFENPGSKDGEWKKHVAIKEVSGESPDFEDITGDRRPELICINGGQFGYASPKTDGEWDFVAITPKGAFGGFTHGQGLGDVNTDGRIDLLETNGWWEQPSKAGEPFSLRPFKFAEAGGADMFAYDFDGDGDSDVVSSQNAHGWGLKWFENRGNAVFVPHAILGTKPEDNAYGLAISQMHAIALADINGDGINDIVTGKRFYAHGAGGDVGAQELPVLYWFQTVRGTNGVEFIPHLIDETSGVGTQVTVGDVTKDGLPDILVGNKRGTFLFVHRVESVSDEQFAASLPVKPTGPRHLPGTADFANGVRSTEALDPESERRGFLLPQGFKAELVAAEPEIQKPMNLAFDTRGRLWVSMSLEYPYAAPLDKPSRDVIKVFEDTDHDGRFDKNWVFADGLNIPIGLYPYKDGVICCSIPNLWHLRDTDGDGKCDRREILYGPIGWERDTHGMCNAFRRGFDGWLYACHGFNNNTTLKGTDGHSISMSSGNTFRMRLDGSRVENFTFGQVNPFGQCFDPFGNMMTADCHTKPITLLLQGGYYESFGKPHDGLGYVPNVMDHLHGSTAIGGMAQVNSDSFPPSLQGHTFGGNVMTSRINRNSLVSRGSSIRAQEEPDFLISKDSWFRPVDLVFGPDGALYVADFYNKIIGHYEVPLPHPGRDRHRGRVWKISFIGDTNRRDFSSGKVARHEISPRPGTPGRGAGGEGQTGPRSSATAAATDLPALTPPQLVAALATNNLARRMQIADRLVDDIGPEAVAPARQGLKSRSETVRLHCLWVLFRLKALKDDELLAAFKDESSLVRTHACRVAGAMSSAPPALTSAFNDEHPQVRRAAVMAATVHQDDFFAPLLITLLAKTPADDVHLRHAIRMALRHQLRNEAAFNKLALSKLTDTDAELIAGISLALKTPAAGQFLIKQLGRITITDKTRLVELVKAAASQASPDSVGDLVHVATTRFENDLALQAELLTSMRLGLNQRDTPIPTVVRDWALSLSKQLLRVGEKAQPATLNWFFSPLPGQPNQGNSFVIQQRVSQDGSKENPFFSTLPSGEQRTGIYRSEPFTLEKTLSFWSAGHIGPPGERSTPLNLIRLIDAKSGEKLFEVPPPRNDMAQQTRWDTLAHVGKSAFVEIVDGDTRSGYAWLAVGRFSIAGLNPNGAIDEQRKGAALVGLFALTEFRPVLADLLKLRTHDRETAVVVSDALVQLKFDARLAALIEVFKINAASDALRTRAAEVLISSTPAASVPVLQDTLKVATSVEQLRVCERLASDELGADALATLAESGIANAALLTKPTVQPKLAVVKSAALKKRLDALIAAVPAEDAKIEELIKLKRTELIASSGNRDAGLVVFKKSCLACHKVGTEGNTVGPNLDGIGNRGLDRLLEDTLAPNRNVDVAFRTTTIVFKDGRVQTGLVKPAEGQQLLLIDNLGKPQMIKLSDIEDRVPSKLSLMPANWGEQIPPDQFRDLIAYVLSLRQQ